MIERKPFVNATPFHARTAGANPDNSWINRNGFTLSAHFGDVNAEALCARTRVAVSDISWRWRAMLEGPQAGEFLSRLATRDVAKLAPGEAQKALWLNDGGAVRGAGVFARYGRESFLLIAAAKDEDWIAAAARSFDVALRDCSLAEGGLAVTGPYAKRTLLAAGLEVELEPLAFRKLFWRGLDVTVSRWGEQNGYEIWCAADDGIIVWDRLMAAGAPFGIEAAGLTAMDVLDIEAGVARPGRDYDTASDGFAPSPTPRSLKLERLIEEEHKIFNGRAAWLAGRDSETKTIAGIEIDSETPAPFTPLTRNGDDVGRTLSACYSPVLRRAIALAQLETAAAEPGTVLSLTLPPSRDVPELRTVSARVVTLPFAPAPDPIAA
ncbi:MAG: aminomethyl transferase family protein [Proteobacteria bacterium]|nr:aminomethyl transferase family protein [Pseudomonadota bacterium]